MNDITSKAFQFKILHGISIDVTLCALLIVFATCLFRFISRSNSVFLFLFLFFCFNLASWNSYRCYGDSIKSLQLSLNLYVLWNNAFCWKAQPRKIFKGFRCCTDGISIGNKIWILVLREVQNKKHSQYCRLSDTGFENHWPSSFVNKNLTSTSSNCKFC